MSLKKDKKFQLESKYNRYFSEAFKKEKVKDIVEKRISITELCALYGISRTSAYKWIYLYSQVEKGVNTVVQMESEANKTQILQQRIADLERTVGQKQMLIDYLEKGFEIASEELGYDLKKKYAPQRSNGSDGTVKRIPTK